MTDPVTPIPVPVPAPVVPAKPIPVEVVKTAEPPKVPTTASTDPAVAMAGIPVTQPSTAVLASTGPAVPSVDNDATDNSPNKDTSSPAPTPSGATAAVSGK